MVEITVKWFINSLILKTFEAIHSASIGLSKKNWTFTPEVGLNYTTNKLLTDLNGGGNYGGVRILE
jgi:hypothetical protein